MVVNLSIVFLGSNSSNSVSSVSQKMNITREVSCQRLPTVWGDLPRPQYVHSICAYGPHHYHMWRPILLPHHLALHVEQTGVIYLPSTAEAGDSQPLDSSNFEGCEVVFSPIVSNTGKHPWKNDVPEWIEPWMECLMETYSLEAWNLMGFSRGAAWGLDIRSRIKAFGLVLLVGPYFLPRRTDEEKKNCRRSCRSLEVFKKCTDVRLWRCRSLEARCISHGRHGSVSHRSLSGLRA
jgi:hypothetical protein